MRIADISNPDIASEPSAQRDPDSHKTYENGKRKLLSGTDEIENLIVSLPTLFSGPSDEEPQSDKPSTSTTIPWLTDAVCRAGIPSGLTELEDLVGVIAEGVDRTLWPGFLDIFGGRNFDLQEMIQHGLDFRRKHQEPNEYMAGLLGRLNFANDSA